MTDIATRVYNHTFKLDPIIRSKLDTDFYKKVMQQVILKRHPKTQVAFHIIVRSKSVRLAEIIDEVELREQLDHARTVTHTNKELIWLAGNTFFGQHQIFRPEYISWLASSRLPDYELRVVDGQYEIEFHGPWAESTDWEIPALSIINELRARAAMKDLGKLELDVLYARAKAKLWTKIERLKAAKQDVPLRIADFGTRRRHSYLWQRWCCEAMREGLGESFTGTSNIHIAMELGLEAIGTNAHELPMVYTALAGDDPADMRRANYKVLEDWSDDYAGNMLVFLPDAYGTTGFLENAPDSVADWTGARPDSKDPYEGGDELIDWWKSRGRDPRQKMAVLSDGLDVDSIIDTAAYFKDRIRINHGWGTMLTNDFIECNPRGGAALDPMSIVCKPFRANGRPVLKISDNPNKATGAPEEIERYLKVFGTKGMKRLEIRV